MAEETANATAVAEPKPEETTRRPANADTTMTDAPTETAAAAEDRSSEKKEEESQESKPADAAVETASGAGPTSGNDKAAEDTGKDENGVTTNGTTNGTADIPKTPKGGRKASGAAASGGGKKLKGKKSMADLHLTVKPGEYWWARTKGNPAWPSIICDEDMLPDSLLGKRPVSAARADGSIRPDYDEGGKNAKDRRFPIMFLGTNEFAWQVNTELRPLQLSEVNELIAKGQTAKTSKKLWEAYEVAAENHGIEFFKDMLSNHFEAAREEERKFAEAEAKRLEEEEAAANAPETPAPKSAKKGKRKSTTVAADDDLEMPDVDDETEGKKTKSAKGKKRKAPDTEGEEKPAKTPKTTIRIKAPKEPQAESAKKTPKSKAGKKSAKTSDEESEKSEEKPPLTEEEKKKREEEVKEKTRKTVLYLRHRLQKGFLARDSEPKESEMADMAAHFDSLEEYKTLEPEVIKTTKIHKVLKAIIRLNSIPKDDEYKFKSRSQDLLTEWNKTLAADVGADTEDTKANGVPADEEPATTKEPEKKDDVSKVEESTEGKKDEPSAAEVASKTDEPKIEVSSEVKSIEESPAAAAVEPTVA